MSRVGGEVTQGANEPAGVAGSGRRASLDLDSHNSSFGWSRPKVPRSKPRLWGGKGPGDVYLAESRGSYLSARRRLVRSKCGSGRRGPASRGKVTEFSVRSRARCARAIAALRVGPDHHLLFCCLTVPGDCSDVYEREHARELLANRLRARGVEAVWDKEYQRRGAVHYNFWVVVQKGPPSVVFRSWFLSYCQGKRGWGFQCFVEPYRGGRRGAASYVIGYVVGKKDKEYQRCLPEGANVSGRWWGTINTQAGWERRELTAKAFFDLRRIERRLSLQRGRVCGSLGRKVWPVTFCADGPPNIKELVL